MKTKLATKFSITFPAYPWNKMQPYKKTIRILKVFICGGGDLENSNCVLSFQRAIVSW